MPTLTAAVALKPGVSYVTMLVLAALAGVGGGNLGVADRIGGARTTFWSFVLMALAASVVLAASLQKSLILFSIGFIAFYVICVCLTWQCYLRAATRRGLAGV
jgi:nitrate/nitrite transporter NarK